MAGSDTKGHPAGTKTGDLLHVFGNGTLQTLTDISIDPAGNVWAADNWNDLHVATGLNHDPVKSTWAGGDGVTVLYGAARPVKPPRMGPVRTYKGLSDVCRPRVSSIGGGTCPLAHQTKFRRDCREAVFLRALMLRCMSLFLAHFDVRDASTLCLKLRTNGRQRTSRFVSD